MILNKLWRINFISVVVIALSLVVIACMPTSREPMRVGTNIWTGYEPLYLARTLNLYNNRPIKLVEYVSATQTMRGLLDGVIDAGALTLDEALLLRAQGVDIQILLVLDYSNGADAIVAPPSVKQLQDLRGRRIGVETTAVGAYVIHRALEKANLKLDDVTIVPLDISQHKNALTTGSVDAVVTFDPIQQNLIENGAHTLFDTSQIPGEIVDVLVVRTEYIAHNENNIKALIQGWFGAVEEIRQHPKEAMHHLNSRMKLSEAQLNKVLNKITLTGKEENIRVLLGEQPLLLKQAEHLADTMVSRKLLQGKTPAASLFQVPLTPEWYQ